MIGGKIGKVVESDVEGKGWANGSKLRLRVEIDITKPLLRGMIIRAAGTEHR